MNLAKLINDFFKIPIIRLGAMIFLVYYIYEKTKDDPRSISYHINKENINKSLDSIKNISDSIKNPPSEGSQNIAEIPQEKPINDSGKIDSNFIVNSKDLKIGSSENQVKCGNKAKFDYSLFSETNDNAYNRSSIEIIIGENFNKVIEKGIIGMKEGGVRKIFIPKNFSTGYEPYDKLIQQFEMYYLIELNSLSKEIVPNYECK